MTYERVAQLRTPEAFRAYQVSLGVAIPFDEVLAAGGESPLAQSYTVYGLPSATASRYDR